MSDPDAPSAGDAASVHPDPVSPSWGGVAGAPPGTADAGQGSGQADGRQTPAWLEEAARGRVAGRRWPVVLVVLFAVIIVAGWIANQVPVNYYVITPGEATPVSQYIEVPATLNHPLTGKILLTDVFVTKLNALNYLQYRFLESNNEVVSGPNLFGPTPNETQYLDQGYLQMAQAQNFATASALTRLGYAVSSANAGALIYGISPHSPASRTLQVAQVITAVDGTPTATDCALITALHGVQPGTTVNLTVEDSSINETGQFVPGPTVQKQVRVGAPPKGLVDQGCGAPITPTAYLGIDPQTQQNWHFPIRVTVHTADIGGPSAGLAMSLGIIDSLSSGRLTGNRVIAATGTIDQNGNVGDVGGVAEKTVAVERAGATVFFVPAVEKATADAKATKQLHVYAVRNLDQVLQILESLGGSVPTNPVPAQAAP
jgi:PDZ domain-containing protein